MGSPRDREGLERRRKGLERRSARALALGAEASRAGGIKRQL